MREDAKDGVPENERSSVSGLVMSFITHVDRCKQSIIEKLEVRTILSEILFIALLIVIAIQLHVHFSNLIGNSNISLFT